VKWIASSAKLVHTVWVDYKVVISHFETASNNLNGGSKEKTTYKGIRMIVTILFLSKYGHFVGCNKGIYGLLFTTTLAFYVTDVHSKPLGSQILSV
jgi:hypothetical protein